MATQLPDYQTLQTRTQTDLGQFSTDGTSPRRTIEYVLARVLARTSKSLYGYLTWILRQVFPDTADTLFFWRWAAKFGITQIAAVPWEGTYMFTGADASVIADGTELQRSDGQLYNTVGEVTVGDDVSGEALADIIAQEASSDGSCADGITLSLAGPVIGVDTDGTVVSTITVGADVETKEAAQVRLLFRLSNPPRGGGPGDYIRWAKEVAGVTRAWEFPLLEGPNSVAVAFARDLDDDPVPDAGARSSVLSYLQSKAPVTVSVSVITLVAAPLDITLTDLVPNTATIGTAIGDSVAALLLREGAPGSTLALSRIDEAVSEATDETSHVMSIPAAAVTWLNTELPVLGTITRP